MPRDEVRAGSPEALRFGGANPGLLGRFRIALSGMRIAWREDSGARNQIIGAIAMLATLVLVQPSAYWWALAIFASLTTLALELMNTALERMIDLVHSEFHPAIKKLKDTAAAAVVVSSVGLLAIGVMMIWSTL